MLKSFWTDRREHTLYTQINYMLVIQVILLFNSAKYVEMKKMQETKLSRRIYKVHKG